MRIAALTYRIASGHRHTIFTRWLLLSAQLERRAIFILFFLIGEGVGLEFAVHEHFALANVPYYIILGILCGLVSVYFIRTNIRIEKFITGIKNQFKRILVGGALLGLLIYIFPPLYGEGYSSLEALLTDNADALLNNTYFFDFRNYAFVVVLYVIC